MEDCIISLWNLGVRDDTLSTMFQMNKKAVVQVNTPLGKTDTFEKDCIVKQGTVFGPPMCSTSTAEFADLNKSRGFPIGSVSINTVIFVDDIANINTSTDDVIESHKYMLLFSLIKRLPMSGPKCILLPINVPRPFTIPVLSVDDINMEIVEKALYLGLFHNSKGNNEDMINDRVQKGMTCMVSVLAMCNEVTLGMYVIQSLILSYGSIFIPTVLYGAQVWTRLTGDDTEAIVSIQFRFLKRILRVPKGTCNSITLLELGVLPIECVLEMLKLSFLFHVLSLEEDDPVNRLYRQQLIFTNEPNWANECLSLRKKYKIDGSDDQVKELSREEWKKIVREAVTKKALQDLNADKNSKSKSSAYPDASELQCKKYFTVLNREYASILFRVRSRVEDIKEFRSYQYDLEDDVTCRACKRNTETLHHVLNECPALSTSVCEVGDEYVDNIEKLERVAVRVKNFLSITKENSEAVSAPQSSVNEEEVC